MIYGKPFEKPPAAFKPGDRVAFRFDQEHRGWYRVIASSHTHTRIEGFYYAIANWELRRVRKAAQSATVEQEFSHP